MIKSQPPAMPDPFLAALFDFVDVPKHHMQDTHFKHIVSWDEHEDICIFQAKNFDEYLPIAVFPQGLSEFNNRLRIYGWEIRIDAEDNEKRHLLHPFLKKSCGKDFWVEWEASLLRKYSQQIQYNELAQAAANKPILDLCSRIPEEEPTQSTVPSEPLSVLASNQHEVCLCIVCTLHGKSQYQQPNAKDEPKLEFYPKAQSELSTTVQQVEGKQLSVQQLVELVSQLSKQMEPRQLEETLCKGSSYRRLSLLGKIYLALKTESFKDLLHWRMKASSAIVISNSEEFKRRFASEYMGLTGTDLLQQVLTVLKECSFFCSHRHQSKHFKEAIVYCMNGILNARSSYCEWKEQYAPKYANTKVSLPRNKTQLSQEKKQNLLLWRSYVKQPERCPSKVLGYEDFAGCYIRAINGLESMVNCYASLNSQHKQTARLIAQLKSLEESIYKLVDERTACEQEATRMSEEVCRQARCCELEAQEKQEQQELWLEG